MYEPFSLRTSRRSFIINYLIGIALLFYLFFTDAIIILPPILTYVFILLISIFFLEPEAVIFYSNYHIKEENLVEIKGVLTKKRIAIPYKSISNTLVNKGILGRIFKFGDIRVTSTSGRENSIVLKGIKHPEKALNLIEKFIESKN